MYVSLHNDKGMNQMVTDEILSSWDPHWQAVNEEFEVELKGHKNLSILSGYMFFCVGWKPSHGGLDELHQNVTFLYVILLCHL